MAEAIFHELASKQGVRDEVSHDSRVHLSIFITIIVRCFKWIVDSAATSGHEAGSPIYSSAQRILKKHGINYEHTARKVSVLLVNVFPITECCKAHLLISELLDHDRGLRKVRLHSGNGQ